MCGNTIFKSCLKMQKYWFDSGETYLWSICTNINDMYIGIRAIKYFQYQNTNVCTSLFIHISYPRKFGACNLPNEKKIQ